MILFSCSESGGCLVLTRDVTMKVYAIILVALSLLAPRDMMAETTELLKKERKSPSKEFDKNTDDKEQDSTFWYNKGALFSVYGNDGEAVKCFKKTIKINDHDHT